MKPKDSEIWNKKLIKTAKDVEDFLRKKPKSNSTHHVNMLVHCLSNSRLKAGDVFDTSSKSEKDENIQKVSDAQKDQNYTNKTCDKCEACTCNSKYVVNLDSILVLIFAIQKLLQSYHPCTKMYRAEEEGSEAPYRDGSISEIPTNEEFFDIDLDGTEDDETPEEQNASENSSNGQPHKFQKESHSVTEACEADESEPFDNEYLEKENQ